MAISNARPHGLPHQNSGQTHLWRVSGEFVGEAREGKQVVKGKGVGRWEEGRHAVGLEGKQNAQLLRCSHSAASQLVATLLLGQHALPAPITYCRSCHAKDTSVHSLSSYSPCEAFRQ